MDLTPIAVKPVHTSDIYYSGTVHVLVLSGPVNYLQCTE